MAYFNQRISLNSIQRHSGTTDPRLTNFDGDAVFEAYLGNLAAAKKLADGTNPLYQDAWLSLNLAVECLFKHLYFLILHEIETTQPSPRRNLLGPIDYHSGFLFYHQAYKSRSFLSASDLGHEVMDLWHLLERFTSANSDQSFQDLKNFIPTKTQWIDARYERRNNTAYQRKYQEYATAFESVLNGIFGGLS